MNLVDALEAVLFAADAPVPTANLAGVLGYTEGQVVQALEVLEARLEERGGIRLANLAGGYQLCTKPEYAETVARFLKPRGDRLGKSALEVLAIVAYRQPITGAEIEQVRGVQSDYGIRSLVERRLIEEVGRKNAPGRPVLWGTTPNFLHVFNLKTIGDLPSLDEVETKSLEAPANPSLFDESELPEEA